MQPGYKRSHAIVIGVNKYRHVNPLGHAVNDAEAIAATLEASFSFKKDDICLLRDSDATGPAIRKAFLKYAGDSTETDDRLFVFFAGHGHTVRGRKGEIGYLIPYDGNLGDLSTLVRWSDLTNDAELIEAKHILFVMDACYSGLAINRSLLPGARRFLNDMMQRHSRQVITAGKADEPVSDIGGPRAGHSIFTGHLLDALDGKAASDGILTANGVMGYVYRAVANDPHSQQTPHCGILSGDGDFVFNPPAAIVTNPAIAQDKLVSVIGPTETPTDVGSRATIEAAKSLLATPEKRISLHELVVRDVRTILPIFGSFEPNAQWSPEEFSKRLSKYNDTLTVLRPLEMLLAYWGDEIHRDTIAIPPKRIAEQNRHENGLVVWADMRWYPVLVLTYCCALGALASKRYSNLADLLNTPSTSEFGSGDNSVFLEVLLEHTSRLGKGFKTIPTHERHFVPTSEYLFIELQPVTDDLLFVGNEYEALFDRAEIFIFLQHLVNGDGYEGVGRFAWKHQSRRSSISPLAKIIDEGNAAGSEWGPLKAGLFGGSKESFVGISQKALEMIGQLPWQ